MSIKYEFQGMEALQRQIELLKYYPEIATKYFRPAMEQVVSGVKERIRANVPIKTGFASATLMSKVVGKGMNITGYVGWGGAGNVSVNTGTIADVPGTPARLIAIFIWLRIDCRSVIVPAPEAMKVTVTNMLSAIN